MKKITLLFTAFLLTLSVLGQAGYDWGDNKVEAQQSYLYLTSCVKAKEYEKAYQPASWLLNNAPNLHVDLYKQALKVYEALEKAEKDETRKIGLQDTILWMYDTRIAKFNDNKAKVLNRKGLVAYKYLSTREGTDEQLYALYDTIITLNGKSSYKTHTYIYMILTCKEKRAGRLTEDQVLDHYDTLTEILEYQEQQATAKGKSTETILKIKDQLDKSLTSCINIDCDFVQTNFGPKFKEDPSDLKMAKRIYSLLRSNTCVSNDLYLQTSEVVLNNTPSVSGYRERGNVLRKMDKDAEAINDYEKAIELSKDNAEKAELYLKIAGIYKSKGQKVTARSYAYKCIELGESKADAYNLIGNMYMYSYDECTSEDLIQSRSIYIAAYNMYQKAGNTKSMAEAKKNFPSNEEIFLRGKKVGDSINTGCWINETVTIQTR